LIEEARRLATREDWRYWHVRTITVAIERHAEAATGNRHHIRCNG
jgi:hypothetical protein